MHAKPPIMSKSSQKFNPNSSITKNQEQSPNSPEDQGQAEEARLQREKKEKEKFDRLQQMAILREEL